MMDKDILAALQERYSGHVRPMQSLHEMLSRLGHPATACVHIAGTNGKGSVAAMLERMLRFGHKTGRFTSPALSRINERIALNGAPIDDALLQACAKDVLHEERACGLLLTAFDRLTLTALLAFACEKVDIAVLECGMGGRLDSTNIVTPLVSVITRIGLDHTQFLGGDIESIAKEKSGIIKKGVSVVCARQDIEAARVIEDACRAQGAPLFWSEGTAYAVESSITGQTLRFGAFSARLKLAGAHQVENAEAAVMAALRLPARLRPSCEAVKAGLEQAVWPGRLEWIPGERAGAGLLLDGAHNPQGAQALASAVRTLLPGRDITLLCAVSADKDVKGMGHAFAGFAHSALVTALPGGVPCEALAAALRDEGIECDVCERLDVALMRAQALAGDVVVVAGSLYLVGAVRQMTMDN